jgi:hypothetical protein
MAIRIIMGEKNYYTFNHFLLNIGGNEDDIKLTKLPRNFLYNKRYDIYYSFDGLSEEGYYNKYEGLLLHHYIEYTKVLLFLSNLPSCRLYHNNQVIIIDNNLKDVIKYLGISIKRKNIENYTVSNEWLSSSLLTPSVINDDWATLNKVQSKRRKTIGIKEEGLIFENKVVQLIKDKHHKDFYQIGNSDEAFSIDKFKLTIEKMAKGIPFIYQAVLHDVENKLLGSIDLLVRSDYLELLCNKMDINNLINPHKGCYFSDKWHYVVVDIKNKKIKLNADMKTVGNEGDIIYMNKGQIYLYNNLLGEIQDYVPNYGYILGNGWKSSKESSDKLFERLGVIDFEGKDKDICKKMNDGIELVNKYSEIDLKNPPEEISINVKNSYDDSEMKKEIAYKKGDISMLPFLKYKQKNLAKQNGIYSWRDERCTSNILGIYGKQGELLDKIIIANRENKFFVHKINVGDYLNVFVDFESVYTDREYVYMIGLVYNLEGREYQEQYYCNRLDDENEKQIFKLFDERLKGLREKNRLRLYHWGSFEVNKSLLKGLEWYDMIKLLKDEQIVVPGMFNYKLKDVGMAMYRCGMVRTKWDTNIKNGYESMIEALKYYEKGDKNILESIKKYNLVDCKVMKEIYECLKI